MGREVGLSLNLSPEGPPAPQSPQLLGAEGLWGFLAGMAVVFPRVSATPGEWPQVPWGDPRRVPGEGGGEGRVEKGSWWESGPMGEWALHPGSRKTS